MARKKLLFLMWDIPWPLRSGKAIRTHGLLKALSKYFDVDVILMSRELLTDEQRSALTPLCSSMTALRLATEKGVGRFRLLFYMLRFQIPYHCAAVKGSLREVSDLENRIRAFPGPIVADHFWTFLVRTASEREASRWIVDQVDECISMWWVYMKQGGIFFKLICLFNYLLSFIHYKRVYRKAGCVISVCEEDRSLTLSYVPQAKVEVILNGVDCSSYVPPIEKRQGPFVLLFTGTSVRRNLVALERLVRRIFPSVREILPEATLVVGGNFDRSSQSDYAGEGVRFTGPVEDIRQVFRESDLFVVPFEDAHGSKLKVAEAMAMGLPIVSTPQGVRGFQLEPGRSVFIAESDEDFVRGICSLASDPGRRIAMGGAARKKAEDLIDWSAQGLRLKEIVDTVSKGLR